MNARKTGMAIAALVTGLTVGIASAKLPPPTDEQKAKAEEAKAKAAEGAKKESELLAKYQDRAADSYKKAKTVKTGTAAPEAQPKK